MPELPEIEAIRLYLSKILSGQAINSVKSYQHTVIRNPSADEFVKLLEGVVLNSIERIGKIILFLLDKDDFRLYLYIDHGLTGRLAWGSLSNHVPKKTVFSLEFSNKRNLIYHDKRLHGAIWLYKCENDQYREYPDVLKDYGPDILSITNKEFNQAIKNFRGEIKRVITNQRFITGIGNAYSDEILFDSGIHPFTKRSQLTEEELSLLFQSCRKILLNATANILDILNNTQKLNNQNYWRQQIMRIHTKGGEPCPICTHKISTIKANRFTNFCRRCQISKNPNFF
ncbi:MAG: Fpg/Nei family DNA glycosylase [Candidatus Hodarchaeota archaeon]